MKGCRPLNKKEWEIVFLAVRGANQFRTRALIFVGRKTGFRVSELLSLKIRDLIHDGRPVKLLTVARQNVKGGKKKNTSASSRTIQLHFDTHPHIMAQYEKLKEFGCWRPDDFFFQSRAKGNMPIDRVQAWRDCVEPVRRLSIEGKIGTHGLMRKTFAKEKLDYLTANWVPGKEVPFHVLQRCTGHKTQEALMSYVRFADEDVEDAIMNS